MSAANPDPGTCYDIRGRVVQCGPSDDLAIGLYFINPEDSPVDCGVARNIKVVTGSRRDENGELIDVLYACNGSMDLLHLSDVYVLDDLWKPYLLYGLILAIAILSIKIFISVR